MSKRTVTILKCDRCKKEDLPGTASFFVQTGWTSCPAGGHSETDGKDIDLCPGCMAKTIGILLDKNDLIRNEKFLKEFIK